MNENMKAISAENLDSIERIALLMMDHATHYKLNEKTGLISEPLFIETIHVLGEYLVDIADLMKAKVLMIEDMEII